MLNRNASKRLSAKQAANICQVLLWAPSSWVSDCYKTDKKGFAHNSKNGKNKQGTRLLTEGRSTQEIVQWLLTLTTKVLYEARFSNPSSRNKNFKRRNYEYQLVATFLSRISLHDIQWALNWIHQN